MKFNSKFLMFVGIIMAVLCTKNANSAAVNCPAGCFCLNNGKYNNELPDVEFYCGTYSAVSWEPTGGCTGHEYGHIAVVSSSSCGTDPYASHTYFLDQFSEYYEGRFGFYGFINDEFVYVYRQCNVHENSCNGTYDVFQCPYTHPHSATGSSKLTDCFKYDANGQKVYYEIPTTNTTTTTTTTVPKITCAEGTYLPANATVCAACLPNKHHICPGGSFYQRDKIQGLKVQCAPGKYLKQDAIQCSSCSPAHLCLGGVYNAGEPKDQGYVVNNGYVFNGNRAVQTCNPGYYMPGNSQTCTACTDNYACPGGIFYTDGGPYRASRGRIFCAYGHANDAHTECIATTTLPSLMLQQIEQATTTQQNQPEMSAPQPQPVVSGQRLQSNVAKGKQRLSTGNRWQPAQSVGAKQQSVSVSVEPQSTTNTKQDDLETAKRLISSGVAIPVN